MNSELVAIARIGKPRGIRGEVVATLLTDFPERFENLERVVLLLPSSEEQSAVIEGFRFHKDRVLLKLEGIDSIDDAEILRGALVCVLKDETVELEDDEFFDWELVDCEVIDVNKNQIGTVKEVFRASDNVNLVVKGETKEYMIPFVSAICVSVDIENKRIEVDLPEGLLDF